MTILEINKGAVPLAEELVLEGALPAKAENDALHISVAAVHRIAYLLTWNCRHLANASIRGQIETICANHDYKAPVIAAVSAKSRIFSLPIASRAVYAYNKRAACRECLPRVPARFAYLTLKLVFHGLPDPDFRGYFPRLSGEHEPMSARGRASRCNAQRGRRPVTEC